MHPNEKKLRNLIQHCKELAEQIDTRRQGWDQFSNESNGFTKQLDAQIRTYAEMGNGKDAANYAPVLRQGMEVTEQATALMGQLSVMHNMISSYLDDAMTFITSYSAILDNADFSQPDPLIKRCNDLENECLPKLRIEEYAIDGVVAGLRTELEALRGLANALKQ